MTMEGGCECYQTIGRIFLYISADFKKNFKGQKSERTYGAQIQYHVKGLVAPKKQPPYTALTLSPLSP